MFMPHLRAAFLLVLIFTVITGLLYPLLVTGIAQVAFPEKANGSLIHKDGRIVGSRLIGQQFTAPQYFWSRPSATTPYAYNGGSSTGTNYGPLNPALLDVAKQRLQDLRSADSTSTSPVPVDLVTSSGSGLDPDISVAAALYQVHRVSRSRNIPEDFVRRIVEEHTQGRQLGFLGEPRVNVLELNLALDEIHQSAQVIK